MKTKLLASLFVLGGSVVSQQVLAENGHAYNGSYCENYMATDAANVAHQYNGLRNTTGNNRYVTCPIAVDEIAVTTGTTQVWLHYTGAGTLRCTLNAMNGNGSVRQSKSASRVGTGWVSIPNLTTEDYWGSSVIYCNLPGNGTLNTVWFGEKN